MAHLTQILRPAARLWLLFAASHTSPDSAAWWQQEAAAQLAWLTRELSTWVSSSDQRFLWRDAFCPPDERLAGMPTACMSRSKAACLRSESSLVVCMHEARQGGCSQQIDLHMEGATASKLALRCWRRQTWKLHTALACMWEERGVSEQPFLCLMSLEGAKHAAGSLLHC